MKNNYERTEGGDNQEGLSYDDALKVFVLNRELLDKKTSVEEFAGLYEELKEFEEIDTRFEELHDDTVRLILAYAESHMDAFAQLV